MGKLSPFLFDDFAETLQKLGVRISKHQQYLDISKWNLAKIVNEHWDSDGYASEVKDKREYYRECSRLLPVMLFGHSGETLRRWCETQAHYSAEPDIEILLHGSSFDHLLKAKRLEMDGRVKAVLAVAEAIENKMTADGMVSHFDPDRDGPNSRHFMLNKLFSWSEKMWVPKPAADLLLQAAKIIKASLEVKDEV